MRVVWVMLLALGCSSDPGTATAPDAAGGAAGADAGAVDSEPAEAGTPDAHDANAPFVCWYGGTYWGACDGGYGCVDGVCMPNCGGSWDPICPARGGTCVDGWCHPPDGGAP